MFRDTNDPVYKLMTNKLQLVFSNVLIRSIFESLSFIRTGLRCDGIVNDQFISQSLLSPKVQELLKSVNIC